MENAPLADYLSISRITLLKEISSKKRVFELLGKLLADNLENVQATQICSGLLARERLGTTALGEGVAIPHCRIDNISAIRCAVIKLDHGVDFDAPDGARASLICGLLVPAEATDQHLQVLSQLAEFLSRPKNRAALCACENAQQLLAAFAHAPDKHAA